MQVTVKREPVREPVRGQKLLQCEQERNVGWMTCSATLTMISCSSLSCLFDKRHVVHYAGIAQRLS